VKCGLCVSNYRRGDDIAIHLSDLTVACAELFLMR